jgi:hypothetical protein
MKLNNLIMQQELLHNWMLRNVHNRAVEAQLLLVIDEAFYLGGHVNVQNIRIYEENSHAIQQVLLHSVEVGMWGTVSAQ